MPLRIPAPKTLSDLIINVDKDWAGKNITNLGSGAFDLNAKFSDIPASAWATVFSTTFPIATVLSDHTKAAHDALGIAPAAHAPTHKDGGADELDVSELAGALGSAGEIPESDGDAVSWVDPDGRYDPKAHVLATTGPHTGTLPLIDLEVGVQGNIIHRGAADWAALAVGAAGEALLSGGAAADVSWGAPVPAAHESTHVRAGSDDIDAPLDARALAMIAQGDMVYLTSVANVIARLAPGTAGQALLTGGPAADPSWGAPAPAAHAASHLDGAADEIDAADLAGTGGAAGEIIESDGDALSYVEPDGRYDPKAHVIATTGPHTGTLPLTDLAAGVQGNVIIRGAADWEALAVGVSGQALLTGGAAADPSWGAPAPAAHATTHQSGGSDEIRNIELLFGHTDEVGSGLKILVTVGENVATGDTLYKKADGKYWKADANSGATMPALLIVIDETIAADAEGLVMSEGPYRNDDRYNWTVGNGEANLLFQHTTGGEIVQLANKPAGAGDQVQVVGWVENANEIYWRPSLELVEVS